MQLRVFEQGGHKGISEYGIVPLRKDAKRNGHPFKRDTRRMVALQPRIKKMAKRRLRTAFLGLYLLGDMLLLSVKSGTSKGTKKVEFRNLLGWIELFDAERSPAKLA